MDFSEKVSKYISDNPKLTMFVIILLIICIIWLYFKSNMISSFSSNKTTKTKKTKIKSPKKSESDSDSESESVPTPTKNDPVVAQLVKDINQNS